MIKIDGEKIKQLRESQGLTQLYMATAIEVTTDTISRWENKRYPTIKKENAQKLAEALGVTLADILLDENEESVVDDAEENGILVSPSTSPPQQKKRRVHLLVWAVLPLVLPITIAALYLLRQQEPPLIGAMRIMPATVIPNSPFPVVIEVTRTVSEPMSIILKETLPEGSKVLQVSPAVGVSSSPQELKWIHKLEGKQRFSYLVEIDGPVDASYSLSGTLTTAKNESTMAVGGADSITLGHYHWADLDKNNVISDQEILTVFDYYSDIDNFTVNIEFIEKMWLGSRYAWDGEKQKITISP